MNLEDGLAFLELMGEVVGDPHAKEAIQEWVDQTKHDLGQLIENQVSPDGTPYVPLSPLTVKRKGHDTALFETGQMIRSLVSNGDGHIEEVTGTSATLGTDHRKDGKPIALYQQEGTKKKSGGVHILARPFVGVNDEMADNAADLIADEIVNQIASL